MGYSSQSAGSAELIKAGESDEGSPVTIYTADDLGAMSIPKIKALAAELGYSITKTLKADIIGEFLTQQNGD